MAVFFIKSLHNFITRLLFYHGNQHKESCVYITIAQSDIKYE